MRRFFRNNGLSLALLVLFALSLGGQVFAGHREYNENRGEHGQPPVGVGEYLAAGHFWGALGENWESEFLQMAAFVLLTCWLYQKGSPESKKLDDVGRGSDREQQVGRYADEHSPRWARATGLRQTLFANSLGAVMGLIFLLSWLTQSIAGVAAFNERQLADLQDPVSWGAYLSEPEFWNRTMQNWQSELLAVASMAILSIYLRQRGSSQSKPVGASHEATGVEG